MPILWSLLRGLGFFVSAGLLLVVAALTLQKALSSPFSLSIELQSFWGTSNGKLLMFAVGGLALLIALYFLARLVNLLTDQQKFVREGSQGAIAVSARAIEDFVQAIVEEDHHLHHAKVLLKHGPRGALNVVLNVKLDFDAAVVLTSERLQQRLKDRIEGHLGVEVHRITVFTERLSKGATQTTDQVPQLEHKQTAPAHEAEGEAYD